MNTPFIQTDPPDDSRRYTGRSDRNVVRVSIKVVPGSRQNEVAGMLGERLKVKVTAPRERGRANEAVCDLLADFFGVSANAVHIVAGHASSEKVVKIMGVTSEEVLRRIAND